MAMTQTDTGVPEGISVSIEQVINNAAAAILSTRMSRIILGKSASSAPFTAAVFTLESALTLAKIDPATLSVAAGVAVFPEGGAASPREKAGAAATSTGGEGSAAGGVEEAPLSSQEGVSPSMVS